MDNLFHHSKEWSSLPGNLTITENRTLIERKRYTTCPLSSQFSHFVKPPIYPENLGSFKLFSCELGDLERPNKWIRDEMTLEKFKHKISCSNNILNHQYTQKLKLISYDKSIL